MNLPQRSVEVKLRSMFDLRALSMALRDAYLKQSEDKFFALFDDLKREPLPTYDHATLEALRYAFRFTWAKDDFAAIVQAGKNLPQEILQKEPLLAAYIAAAREQLEARRNIPIAS